MNNEKIAGLRRDYKARTLDVSDVASDPITQFKQWFQEALKTVHSHAGVEANAMTLATATKAGIPSARIVLLKGVDEKGFIFYTNYESRKGQELEANPQAALVFFWQELERQVRIEGQIERVESDISDQYYSSRPRRSRIGAWASPQSQVIDNRKMLENNMAELETEYGEEKPIPRPAHWGGYRVVPKAVEFWQGRRSRLHDRVRYEWQDGKWDIVRLAP